MNKISPLSTFKASALVAFVFISLALSVHAEVVLPKIFSDNMMLQRNQHSRLGMGQAVRICYGYFSWSNGKNEGR
jgi:hypothetical protein